MTINTVKIYRYDNIVCWYDKEVGRVWRAFALDDNDRPFGEEWNHHNKDELMWKMTHVDNFGTRDSVGKKQAVPPSKNPPQLFEETGAGSYTGNYFDALKGEQTKDMFFDSKEDFINHLYVSVLYSIANQKLNTSEFSINTRFLEDKKMSAFLFAYSGLSRHNHINQDEKDAYMVFDILHNINFDIMGKEHIAHWFYTEIQKKFPGAKYQLTENVRSAELQALLDEPCYYKMVIQRDDVNYTWVVAASDIVDAQKSLLDDVLKTSKDCKVNFTFDAESSLFSGTMEGESAKIIGFNYLTEKDFIGESKQHPRLLTDMYKVKTQNVTVINNTKPLNLQ